MTKPSEIISQDGRLYHLGVAAGEIGESIFIVGDPARAYKVASRFESIEHEVKHREYVTLTGRYRGLPMSVVGTGIGTDNVEIALVELHAAHALDLATGLPRPGRPPLDFIRIGTSGGVQPDVAAGTLCIAEYAIGFDSTGLYFEAPAADDVVTEIERVARASVMQEIAPDARFRQQIQIYASKADPAVHAALVRHALAGPLPSESGITATSPGFFGASSRYVEGLVNTVADIKGALARVSVSGRRVLNMEMESSLLFHLAGALGHRAATICPAISQPGSHGAVVDYDGCVEAAIDVAMAAAFELASSRGALG